MKERPILFQGAMIRALPPGPKTQTRRAVKLGDIPAAAQFAGWQQQDPHPPAAMFTWPERVVQGRAVVTGVGGLCCPYGQPGDRLWVRETFSGPHYMEARGHWPSLPPSRWSTESPIWYWADGEPADGDWTRPRPSIHMPRWASRITLEITSVRVERLADISTQDCWAEGIPSSPDVNPIHEYQDLWESINGPGSWNVNPWVWVVEFRRAA